MFSFSWETALCLCAGCVPDTYKHPVFTKIGLNTSTVHSKHKHLSLYAFQTRRAYWLCLKRDCSSLINVYLICNSNNDALQFYWKLDLSQTAIFPNFVLLAWPTPVQTFCAGIIILHSSISSGFLGHSLCAGLYKQFANLWCLSEYIVSFTIPVLLDSHCASQKAVQDQWSLYTVKHRNEGKMAQLLPVNYLYVLIWENIVT